MNQTMRTKLSGVAFIVLLHLLVVAALVTLLVFEPAFFAQSIGTGVFLYVGAALAPAQLAITIVLTLRGGGSSWPMQLIVPTVAAGAGLAFAGWELHRGISVVAYSSPEGLASLWAHVVREAALPRQLGFAVAALGTLAMTISASFRAAVKAEEDAGAAAAIGLFLTALLVALVLENQALGRGLSIFARSSGAHRDSVLVSAGRDYVTLSRELPWWLAASALVATGWGAWLGLRPPAPSRVTVSVGLLAIVASGTIGLDAHRASAHARVMGTLRSVTESNVNLPQTDAQLPPSPGPAFGLEAGAFVLDDERYESLSAVGRSAAAGPDAIREVRLAVPADAQVREVARVLRREEVAVASFLVRRASFPFEHNVPVLGDLIRLEGRAPGVVRLELAERAVLPVLLVEPRSTVAVDSTGERMLVELDEPGEVERALDAGVLRVHAPNVAIQRLLDVVERLRGLGVGGLRWVASEEVELASTAASSGLDGTGSTAPTGDSVAPRAGGQRRALDRAMIQRVIQRHLGGLRACYEAALLERPELRGRVELSFTVSASGEVEQAKVVSSTLDAAKVERCIVARVDAFRFPAPDGGPVVVRYPFSFEPG